MYVPARNSPGYKKKVSPPPKILNINDTKNIQT